MLHAPYADPARSTSTRRPLTAAGSAKEINEPWARDLRVTDPSLTPG